MASPIINIKFLADLKQFSSQMQNANRSLTTIGNNMKKTGANLTAGLTLPLVGIGTLALKTFSEIEGVSTAFDRLNDDSLLNDLRAATKGTVGDLELMTAAVKAENFQIPLSEMSTLLEFARRRAKDTGESVDYLVDSIVTGIGRKSPLILDNLGISAIALKDNLNGATAAASSISDVTKAVGKIAREELGKMGEDTLTLNELWLQLKAVTQNTFVDLGREIAAIVKPFLVPMVEYVKELSVRFQELSPGTKKWIVILGGVAAAIGPLLALAGTILPAILTGFTLLFSPIGAIAAGLVAIGVIIYKNWAPIKQTLIDIANYFIDLYNESTVFRIAVEYVAMAFKNLYAVGVFVFDALSTIVKFFVDQIKTGFGALGKVIKGALTFDYELIKEGLSDAFSGAQDNIKTFVGNVEGDFNKLAGSITDNLTTAIDNVVNRKKIEFLKEDVDASGVAEAVSDAIVKGVDTGLVGGKTGSGKSSVSTEEDLEAFELQDGLDDLQEIDILTRFDLAAADAESQAFFGVIRNQYEAFVDDTETFVDDVNNKMQNLQDVASSVGDSVGNTFANLAGSIVGSLGLADNGFQGFVKGLVGTITKLISMMLASSMSQAISGATSSGAATGPGAIVATPAFIATAISGVLAAFAAIPKFETGGVVSGSSFYGDKILARVNSNELILNTKQQKSLYNQLNASSAFAEAMPVVLTTKISGSDILLVSEREASKQSRRG